MDISARIDQMKKHPGFADNVGMVQVHNGVVRSWSPQDKQQVECLEVHPAQGKIEAVRQQFLTAKGIFDIVIEAEEGRFHPGDDLLYIIVAGDIREHVKTGTL